MSGTIQENKFNSDSKSSSLASNLTQSTLNFTKNVSKYFMDFLETDFHKRRIPKRHIRNTDKDGHLIGISLKKYESAHKLIFGKLSNEIAITNKIPIKIGKHKSLLSPAVKNFIDQQIHSITDEICRKVINEITTHVEDTASNYLKKPDDFLEQILSSISSLLMEHIVSPIIDTLIHSVGDKLPLGIETAIDSKDEILDYLTGDIADEIIPLLNLYLIQKDIEPLRQYLDGIYSEKNIGEKLSNYFEEYTTSDLYHELNNVLENKKLLEQFELYLYIGSARFSKTRYPLFYIPLECTYGNDEIIIQYDPKIYINRKSLEYINQEFNKFANKTSQLKSISDRILYLDEGSKFSEIIQPILSELSAHFNLPETLSFIEYRNQKIKALDISLDNELHIALFDKADESLVNDYEVIIDELNKGGSEHSDWLGTLLDGFIKKDPVSSNQDVEGRWNGYTPSEKAVFTSPIPLNEEQRKILEAIKKPDCKYIKVEGPPGTGKSHTITAIAFDLILNGKSILVLSDKNEALDVVEDKITSTLNKVRISEKFQNPILRLGRSANNYQSILTKKSIDDIKSSLQAVKSREEEAVSYENEVINNLKTKIDISIEAYNEIDQGEIHKHEYLEKELFGDEENCIDVRKYCDETELLLELLETYAILFEDQNQTYFQRSISKHTLVLEDNALELLAFVILANKYKNEHSDVNWSLINDINESELRILKETIFEYEALIEGFFGTLFKGGKIKNLNQKLNSNLNVANPINLKVNYDKWKTLYNALTDYSKILLERNENLSDLSKLLKLSQTSSVNINLTDTVQEFINNPQKPRGSIVQSLQNANVNFTTNAWLNSNTRNEIQERIDQIREYLDLDNTICEKFSEIPFYDYKEICEAINEIETTKMTSIMDERVVHFFENHRASATTLKEIIKKKQKFPKDKFDLLKEAFPCIIAGVRDYAEYIPLEKDLFDVVVIDEASQVSIAQALPALLRAKTVVVLGDARQFSNVKSSHASNQINNGYLQQMREDFVKDYGKESDILERLKKFDIKTSVLEFFNYIANFDIMLKKHFRGYKELISFSSKYFYQGGLQSMKVRSRHIDETIIFSHVEHDDLMEVGAKNNTNPFEVKFILNDLEKRLVQQNCESVGIITPHTEQQKFISQSISNSKYKDQIYEELKVKVMTFDTCQGEERDCIYYSMVASNVQDRLRYVFPRELEWKEGLDPIRHQRLNVGFSRSKEAIHFVLSKPIEEYSSSVNEAMRHYQNQKELTKKQDASGETDPKSPMEKKVYQWIRDCPFYQLHQDEIELVPQFPIGQYLKQLDQYYDHPNYRCDFLLRHRGESGEVQNLVIEYDGFNEHFKDKAYVNDLNYEHYYNDSDVEREKIIESYGYKFIRINKFNLGSDPIQTLSERIEYMLGPEPGITAQTPGLKKTITAIKKKEQKQCEKCGELKDKKDFYDASLVSKYGRICKTCKRGNTKTRRNNSSKKTKKNYSSKEIPNCPKCSSKMVHRSGKYGEFWGCKNFPRCRGTREIRSN